MLMRKFQNLVYPIMRDIIAFCLLDYICNKVSGLKHEHEIYCIHLYVKYCDTDRPTVIFFLVRNQLSNIFVLSFVQKDDLWKNRNHLGCTYRSMEFHGMYMYMYVRTCRCN